jgi:hypothetical protein
LLPFSPEHFSSRLLFKNIKIRIYKTIILPVIKRNAYRILVGTLEGKSPLERPRRRWVDNIKMDLREIGWDGVGWFDLVQDRYQWRARLNTVMNLRVP